MRFSEIEFLDLALIRLEMVKGSSMSMLHTRKSCQLPYNTLHPGGDGLGAYSLAGPVLGFNYLLPVLYTDWEPTVQIDAEEIFTRNQKP